MGGVLVEDGPKLQLAYSGGSCSVTTALPGLGLVMGAAGLAFVFGRFLLAGTGGNGLVLMMGCSSTSASLGAVCLVRLEPEPLSSRLLLPLDESPISTGVY